jgi:hypothetical protein
MRNLFKLLALGALYLPTAVLAAEPEHRFTHSGVSYRYTVTQVEDGRRVIQGQNLWTGARFRFVVKGDRVEGVSGGQPVSFRTPKAGGVTLAAR